MSDIQKTVEARGSHGFCCVHSDSNAAAKLIEHYSSHSENLQRKGKSDKVGIVGSALGALGGVLGVVPQDADQKNFKVTIKNESPHIFVPMEIKLVGDFYTKSNLNTLGPNESCDFVVSINNHTNINTDNVEFFITGVIAHGQSNGAVCFTIDLDGPDGNLNAWQLYDFNCDEYGYVRNNADISSENKSSLTFVECVADNPDVYPSFGLASLARTPGSNEFVFIITP